MLGPSIKFPSNVWLLPSIVGKESPDYVYRISDRNAVWLTLYLKFICAFNQYGCLTLVPITMSTVIFFTLLKNININFWIKTELYWKSYACRVSRYTERAKSFFNLNFPFDIDFRFWRKLFFKYQNLYFFLNSVWRNGGGRCVTLLMVCQKHLRCHSILDTRISVCSFVRPSCVTLTLPPLDSETGWMDWRALVED